MSQTTGRSRRSSRSSSRTRSRRSGTRKTWRTGSSNSRSAPRRGGLRQAGRAQSHRQSGVLRQHAAAQGPKGRSKVLKVLPDHAWPRIMRARCAGQFSADLEHAVVQLGAIRRLGPERAGAQCRRGARRERQGELAGIRQQGTADLPLVGADAEHPLVRAFAGRGSIRLPAKRGSKVSWRPSGPTPPSCSRTMPPGGSMTIGNEGRALYGKTLCRMPSSAGQRQGQHVVVGQ